MPPTDRLSLPSHRRTLPPNRLATLHALAVSRPAAQRHPARIALSLLALQSLRFGPLSFRNLSAEVVRRDAALKTLCIMESYFKVFRKSRDRKFEYI